jgi:hypothetical protein
MVRSGGTADLQERPCARRREAAAAVKRMGLDSDVHAGILDAIETFATARLPQEKLLELDALDEFPSDEVRAALYGPDTT